MNLRMILCAFGWHRWMVYCRSWNSEPNTQRQCHRCSRVEVRITPADRWMLA